VNTVYVILPSHLFNWNCIVLRVVECTLHTTFLRHRVARETLVVARRRMDILLESLSSVTAVFIASCATVCRYTLANLAAVARDHIPSLPLLPTPYSPPFLSLSILCPPLSILRLPFFPPFLRLLYSSFPFPSLSHVQLLGLGAL